MTKPSNRNSSNATLPLKAVSFSTILKSNNTPKRREETQDFLKALASLNQL